MKKMAVNEYSKLIPIDEHFRVLSIQEGNHYKFLIRLWNKLKREKNFEDKYDFIYKGKHYIIYENSITEAFNRLYDQIKDIKPYKEYMDFYTSFERDYYLDNINNEKIKFSGKNRMINSIYDEDYLFKFNL